MNNRSALAALGVIAVLASSGDARHANAIPLTAFFDTLNASTSVVPIVSAGDVLIVDTVVTTETGPLSQSVTFTVGTGVDRVAAQANWMISSSTGPGPRLVGFNVDLLDSANTLVASDSFMGVLGGFAHSAIEFSSLVPGTYTLRATGTGVRESLLNIAAGFSGPGTGAAALGVGGVPAQGATTTTPTVFFNDLTDSRTVLPPLAAGTTLIIDTLVTSESGPLSQSVTFTLGTGVDGFTGGASWAVSSADGLGPRLIGVNIDLLDSTDTVIFSDLFTGVLAGFADSTFGGAIGPGTYTLRATGTGVRESSLDIALGFTGVAPAAVPQPGTVTLVIAGIAAAGIVARRRRSAHATVARR